MGLISLGAGIAIGYAIGTSKGREKVETTFDSAKKKAGETWNRPDVQDFVSKTSERAEELAHEVADQSRRAAAYASDAVKKAAEQADAAADKAEDIIDEAEETVQQAAAEYKSPETKTTYNGDVISDPGQTTERKGTDWANEGGSKP
ncbi:hypothetical protein [Nesterenkonia populi]|uniref:hypothetical protein n=1 Tax=Nesterenkonia populi TaxID=1591087 RepID=UPI0011BDD498|nr:hypothetical protein [Nesterenkonia populi]